MKNKLTHLNDYLFSQIERLDDEDLTEEELRIELKRSAAVTNVSKQIIANAQLALDAKVAVHEHQLGSTIPMLENKGSE